MEETNNDTQTVYSSITDYSTATIGFICKICEDAQDILAAPHYRGKIFPICDRCLKDLKEFVVSKRSQE